MSNGMNHTSSILRRTATRHIQFETPSFAQSSNPINILSNEIPSASEQVLHPQLIKVFEEMLSSSSISRFCPLYLSSQIIGESIFSSASCVRENESSWLSRGDLNSFSSAKYLIADISPDSITALVDQNGEASTRLTRWSKIVQHAYRKSPRPFLIFRFSLFDWIPLARKSPKKAAYLFVSSLISLPSSLSLIIDTRSCALAGGVEERKKEIFTYITFIEELALILKKRFFIQDSAVPPRVRLPSLFFSLRGMLFTHFSSLNVPFVDVHELCRFSSAVHSMRASVWSFLNESQAQWNESSSLNEHRLAASFLSKVAERTAIALSIEQVGSFSIIEGLIYEILINECDLSLVMGSSYVKGISSLIMYSIVSLWKLQSSLAECKVNVSEVKETQLVGIDSATMRSMLLQLEILLHEAIEKRQALQRSSYREICMKDSSQGALHQLLGGIDAFSLLVIREAQSLLRMNNSLLRQSFSLF